MTASQKHSDIQSLPSTAGLFWMVTLTWVGLFAVRLWGPPDLVDNDQQRPAAYVLDAVVNGHWICQTDDTGDITSKPPLYTWLSALFTLPFPHISRLSLYLPGALALLGIAWSLFAFGAKRFGKGAGFWAAMVFLLSSYGFKHIALARTDALFAFLVFAAALAAHEAWIDGTSWTWFWLLCAASTLTKGPLGILLAAGGLLTVLWEKSQDKTTPIQGSHLKGILLFLLLVGGWFGLAWWSAGNTLVDKMIGKELIGHALADGKGRTPGEGLYKPTLYFLSRFLPWSLLTCLAFWRIVRHPAHDTELRLCERYWSVYFCVGLVIFSIAPHQRPDHLLPLLPAAALLAGRELALYVAPKDPVQWIRGLAGGLLLILLLASIFFSWQKHKEPVQKTLALQQLAHTIEASAGCDAPVEFLDAPYTLQFYLNSMRLRLTIEDAQARLLESQTVYLALQVKNSIDGQFLTALPGVHILETCYAGDKPYVQIISNCPQFERPGESSSTSPNSTQTWTILVGIGFWILSGYVLLRAGQGVLSAASTLRNW